MFGYVKEVLETKVSELKKEEEKNNLKISEYDNRLDHVNCYRNIKKSIIEETIMLILTNALGIYALACCLIDNLGVISSLCGWGFILSGSILNTLVKKEKEDLKNNYGDLLDLSMEKIKELDVEYEFQKAKYELNNFSLKKELEKNEKLLSKICEYKEIVEDIERDLPVYLADNKEEYDLLTSYEVPRVVEEEQLSEFSRQIIKKFPNM